MADVTTKRPERQLVQIGAIRRVHGVPDYGAEAAALPRPLRPGLPHIEARTFLFGQPEGKPVSVRVTNKKPRLPPTALLRPGFHEPQRAGEKFRTGDSRQISHFSAPAADIIARNRNALSIARVIKEQEFRKSISESVNRRFGISGLGILTIETSAIEAQHLENFGNRVLSIVRQ